MGGRGRRDALAWGLFGGALALIAVALVFTALNIPSGDTNTDWGNAAGGVAWVIAFVAFPLVGLLVALRRPENRVGWLCLAIGLTFGGSAAFGSYDIYARHHSWAPWSPWLTWASNLSWPIWIVLIGVYLILLFPDGRLPAPRWRFVLWTGSAGALTEMIVVALKPGHLAGTEVDNPIGIAGAKGLLSGLEGLLLLLPAAIVAAAVAMIRRYRRSRGIVRLQLKWFSSTALVVGLLFIAALVGTGADASSNSWSAYLEDAATVGWAALPIAAGIAILRHRLYDIDVVINRALVFGALAVFITGVYVAIVVGIGAAVGAAGNIVLSIVATAVVAVAFHPVRERVQRAANRIVYGHRASPYEVLTRLSQQLAGAYVTEEALENIARVIVDGTAAASTEVWLRSGSELRLAASWPANGRPSPRPMELDGDELPALAADRAVPVRHQDELLGALAVRKRPGESLTPTEEHLLNDLAAQAGIVLRNVGLAEELMRRLDELDASRRRLVTAQDEERRRLERNLHDGAQQNLVALKIRLNLAARLARGNDALEQMLVALQGDADEAVEALRDLARGIYPPLLAEAGLPTALEAQARKAPVRVVVEADSLGRYSEDVEAAVYFCCLEALQNVAKYANASLCQVRLREEDGVLHFSVADDGAGFDSTTRKQGSGMQHMADRLGALGGDVEVEARVGEGTTLRGRLPVTAKMRPAVADALHA